jgi:mevalonate kinase
MNTEVVAQAPGKIILFGEHAVVYGQPAIAAPLTAVQTQAVVRQGARGRGVMIIAANLARTLVVRPEVQRDEHALIVAVRLFLKLVNIPFPDLEIQLSSTIPVASGLGSGAAATTALLRALSDAVGHPLSTAALNDLVYEIEKLHHGTPSGIDNTVITHARPVYFVREAPIETFAIGHPLTLIVADTGIASPTHQTVGDVRRLYEADPDQITPILAQIGAIAQRARQAIESGDEAELGDLMLENHALLRKLTVSSARLDSLVEAASRAGAYGAKLSGGGRGGNMIALVAPEQAEAVRAVLVGSGAKRTIQTTLS